MPEKKLKPAAKQAATSKTGIKKSSTVSSKPKTTKTTASEATKKTAAKKPVVKNTATKKTATVAASPKPPKITAAKNAATSANKKAAGGITAPPKATSAIAMSAAVKPTPEERYLMVQTAAYFIAEQHGFQGRSDEHWAAAEREIAAQLGC